MNANLISVLEDYFGESVSEVRDVEAKIAGRWYQVVNVEEADNSEELSFVKGCPTHYFEGERYYVVEQ